MSKKDKKEESKKTEKAPSKRASNGGSLPALFDVTFSISKLVVLLIGALTSVISVISGATALHAAIRGCLAMFAIGLTLWMINWIMVHDSLTEVLIKVSKLKSQSSESNDAHTFEKNA